MGMLAVCVASLAWRPVAQAQSAPVARVADLGEPWSSVEFSFAAVEPVPGILIRLPDGTLYAASRICTHQACTMVYNKNAKEVSDSYDVQVANPALTCPCHLSVFDPAKGGKVVGGPAPRPPQRFRIRVSGGNIFVDGLDAAGS